jgi:hypothetical protein
LSVLLLKEGTLLLSTKNSVDFGMFGSHRLIDAYGCKEMKQKMYLSTPRVAVLERIRRGLS